MNELYMIHSFYRFSLDSFIIVIKRAIDIVAAEMAPKKKEIVEGEEEEEEPEEEE
jgi:dynein heavy chain, axonemal